MSINDKHLSEVERIKAASQGLRGTLLESLHNPVTGAVGEDDVQVIKFHGIYQQDNRDLRVERHQQKLEPLYQFMARLRLPGGVLSGKQWLALSDIAHTYGSGSLRITSRQSIQLHGLFKSQLQPTLQALDKALLDTVSACGDVNRNVIASAAPQGSAFHAEVYAWAKKIAAHLLPQTHAYHEIWLDGQRVTDTEEDPLYGLTYLPRKFKIAIAVPPHNDVDVFTQDLGFIAINEGGRLVGFNVCVGGGLGRSHNKPDTYPRLADVCGFCIPEQVLGIAEAVLTTQRDHGDRGDRSQARLKYTVDRMGLAVFMEEVRQRTGFPLSPSRPFHFETSGDRFGWLENDDGTACLTLFIPGGRVVDIDGGLPLMSGLDALARLHHGEIRLTCNQNLVIAGIAPSERAQIEDELREYRLDGLLGLAPIRTQAMACVALPTCPLAMAEAERYLPVFLDRLETLLSEIGLKSEALTVRMTGCPNGCARPYLAEIGLVGKAPGLYDLYLGGDRVGLRLNTLYREALDEEALLTTLRPLLLRFASKHRPGETFGDFVHRHDVLQTDSNHNHVPMKTP
ncbi:assimilatory sulfite reductase (NADPH) hemoprotein subunit [Acidithiobacillus ferrivorans]|nr:assimilatory sulfite reductase (NADPH) hemoprotein subunit [Acidithiobacillus ferrivorans]